MSSEINGNESRGLLNNEDQLGVSITSELSRIKQFAEMGHYTGINDENFPQINSEDPDLLTVYKLEGIGNFGSLLYRALRNSSENEQMRKKVLEQMGLVRNEYNNFSFSNDNYESSYDFSPFYMLTEEREGLRSAIELGGYEVINDTNYPALSSLSKEMINELKAEAINNRIARILRLISIRRGMIGKPGLVREDIEDPICKDLNNRVIELIEIQSQLLQEELI